MRVGNMRRGGIGGLRGNLRQGFNPMQMGMQAPQGMMPPQQFAMPQGRGAMRQGFNPMQMGMMAPAAMTLASPMQPRPQQMAGMDAATVARQMQNMMAQEQALQARRLAPQQFGPMGGPGFAQPLSPPPSPQQFDLGPQVSLPAPQPFGGPQQQQMQQQMLAGPQQQGGQAMGGAKWTMEIKPSEGMAGGGIVPMVYMNGGYIPAYGFGGWLKRNLGKVAKGALKVAPAAAMFIPGVGPLASAGIGALAGGLSAKLEGADFGSALSKGLSTGIKTYAGKKAIGGFKDAFDAGSGSFFDKLESGLGGLAGSLSKEQIAQLAPMLLAQEDMAMGHAGGAGGDMTSTTVMPGGGGGRPSGAMPDTITQIEAPTASRYNLFDQMNAEAGQTRAGGGPVGSLYAMRRFGGGEIDGYRIGGRVSKRGRRGRRGRGRGRGRESSRPRRSPRKNVRPPTRAPVQRAQPVAPPPPPVMAPPVMDMPVAAPPPRPAPRPAPVRLIAGDTSAPPPRPAPRPAPVRPPPMRAPAPPPPMAPAIEDMIPETVSASPVRAPERPKAPPVNRPMAAFPDALGIEDDGPPMMPQPAAPRAPRKMSPERERPVDIPVVGGLIPTEGEPAPFAPEIEEILPATTAYRPSRGEERRRSRRGREGGEGGGLRELRLGSEGGGERREKRRSRDSGRRSEEGGELGGERGETTSGAEDTGRGFSYEEGRYRYGDRMTEEQKRMAEKFATKDPESPLTLGVDEFAKIENIRAIEKGKPSDDIVSIEGTMIEPENVNDPTPPSIVGYQNPQLLAQRDAQLMATPVTYQRPPPPPPPPVTYQRPPPPPPPPPPPVVQGTGLGLGEVSGTPAEAASINMFGSGASPSDMRTEADQFAESNPRMAAMLARMDAPEAPLKKYVPEPEGKAEGGLIAEMQQDETGMQILTQVAQALQDPQNAQNAQTIEGFEEAFGPEALQELMQMLGGEQPAQEAMMRQQGGLVPGSGDAMEDNILGVVDAGQPNAYPIKFSSGEFVMAGDVVAGLGSGNTQRGAQVLNQLQDDVRMSRNGTTQQAPPVDLSDVLPSTYGERYG